MSKTIVNTECLMEACHRLGLAFEVLDKNHNLIRINLDKPYFFSNQSVPFNNGSVENIAKDKEFFWYIARNLVRMPETRSYFDPQPLKKYLQYKKFSSIGKIADDIIQRFGLPVITKRNSGSIGNHVFLCRSKKEILSALKRIFNKQSRSYDFLALAQAFVSTRREYRAVFFKKKLLMLYEKNLIGAEFKGNLSPLHWKNSNAVIERDKGIERSIINFISPVFDHFPIEFVGFDIIEDKNGKLWLLEANSKPGFDHLVKNNGKEPLIQMYEKLLTSL